MNRLIARLFGLLLAVIHVAVIAGLIFAIVDIATGTGSPVPVTPETEQGTAPIPFAAPIVSFFQSYGRVIGIFVGYILVMGGLSTLVSINEHMRAIRKMSEAAGTAELSRSRSSSVRRRGDR